MTDKSHDNDGCIRAEDVYATLNDEQKKHYEEFKDLLHARFGVDGEFCGPLPRDDAHALDIAKRMKLAEGKGGFNFCLTYDAEFIHYHPSVLAWRAHSIDDAEMYLKAQEEIKSLKALLRKEA